MAPITKLTCKSKAFEWTIECHKAWEIIKVQYVHAPIMIAIHWDLKFHGHTKVSNLAWEQCWFRISCR